MIFLAVALMTRFLFIYGTLLPDHAPAEIAPAVRKLRRIARGKTPGQLYDLGDYPGAIFTLGPSTISGEVYQLLGGMNLLRRLDAYEEFDERHPPRSLFVRKKRPVRLEDGRRVLAWVYEYHRDPSSGTPIPHGDYRHWMKTRKLAPR